MSKSQGALYEKQALAYLKKQGLSLVSANFYSRLGEIDLIMLDGQQLVFVEVKARSQSSFASAEETVTFSKQQKIIRTAQFFLSRHPQYQNHHCRFDVLAITIGNKAAFNWLKNAFME